MGVEVGQQWVRDVSKSGRVRPVGVVAVTAYAQYLGTLLLELAVRLPERGDLVRSTACEIVDVKGEDHVLLSLVLAQADPVS